MDTPLFDGELVHARRMIYTPSAFAKSNLVHLQEVGQLQARSPHASTRQGLVRELRLVQCYLMPDETALRELSEQVIEKLKRLTDAEFAGLEFPMN